MEVLRYHLLWPYRGKEMVFLLIGGTVTYSIPTSLGIFQFEDCEIDYTNLYLGSSILSVYYHLKSPSVSGLQQDILVGNPHNQNDPIETSSYYGIFYDEDAALIYARSFVGSSTIDQLIILSIMRVLFLYLEDMPTRYLNDLVFSIKMII